jgi:ATP-binding cassette subfamily F protein 3
VIHVKNITLNLGSRLIFEHVNVNFLKGQHVGIVGKNGAGKSTFLKVLHNSITPDEGVVTRDTSARIAYMPQDITLLSEKTVFDEAFSVFQKYIDIENDIKRVERELEDSSSLDLSEKYIHLLDMYESFNKVKAEQDTYYILKGLGFDENSYEKPVSSLSVGWKMRLFLAQLLLQKADFYLFDEPTNHLDITTQQWFYAFIKNASFGYALVSHDRYFLDGVCDYIFELENHKARLFKGNYSSYLTQKEKEQTIYIAQYERQQKEIARKKALINRFRASANKAKMAQSLIKELDKMNVLKPISYSRDIKLTFPEVKRSGVDVLKVERLEQKFEDKKVFSDVSFIINRGDKVGLIAPNGAGKTTLFNTIIGKYSYDTGKIIYGHNVSYAYFEQDQLLSLSQNKTIYQEVKDSVHHVSESDIKTFLGAFLFSGDDIDKKISVLSGGEKNRVAMVKVLLSKANFLLLDEPTNHLDLHSKEALCKALQQYKGTILIVSHDTAFLKSLTNRIFVLEKKGIIDFPGSYGEYLQSKNEYSRTIDNNDSKVSVEDTASKKDVENVHKQDMYFEQERKKIHKYRKELNAYELQIKKIESSIERVNNQLLNKDSKSVEYQEDFKKIADLQKELDDTTCKWETLFEHVEYVSSHIQ